MGDFYTDERGWVAAWGYGIAEHYEIDSETGMPVPLEKGAYFRVVKWSAESIFEVKYVKRYFGIPVTLGFNLIYNVRDRKVTEREILWAALEALGQRQEKLALRAKKKAASKVKVERVKAEKVVRPRAVDNSDVLGSYPPKKLKKVDLGGN